MISKVIAFLKPPPAWQVPVIILCGIFAGLGFFTFYVSNATSYLSDDPEACINCHVMIPQYTTWQKGSHSRNATCNDCHIPHDNLFNKTLFKMSDGMRHSTYFTLRLEPQVIRVKQAGINVIQENCKRCHEHLVESVNAMVVRGDNVEMGTGLLCWDCHRETPHGRVSSLASTPYARLPDTAPVIPEWLNIVLNQTVRRMP